MSDPVTLLLPVDGSPSAERAVRYVVDVIGAGLAATIHLLNVQPSLSGDVSAVVDRASIDDFRRKNAEVAMAPAKRMLEGARISYRSHIGVGQIGPTIAAFAKELHCTQIVMGTRGLGATLGLLLGSVATHVVAHAEVPVTLIK